MCGIIGYIGTKEVQDILVKGLEHLEYRGYDSAGIAILDKQKKSIITQKVVGRVETLKKIMKPVSGNMGMGHTRWATHGKPSDKNAHPHTDCGGTLALIHNGIIENYLELKQDLLKKGHHFTSETDTEVAAHLIEDYLVQQRTKKQALDLKKAVDDALKQFIGTYALCVMHQDVEYLVVARNGSPLVLGLGDGENFFGSDVAAFIAYTKKAMYLNDFETATVTKDKVTIFDQQGNRLSRDPTIINWTMAQAQKGGEKHFMVKEMKEQPNVVQQSLSVNVDAVTIPEGATLHIVSCGAAHYVGLLGKYLIERLAGVKVNAESGSEFRYRQPALRNGDVFLAISQSGETIDTLAPLRLAKEKGLKTIALVNVVDSTIAREADVVLYTPAGPEICVTTTKAFISQMVVLYRIAEKLSGKKLPLQDLPHLVQLMVDKGEEIASIAQKYAISYKDFLYIARNLEYPIALEGALKLKEISYIHAEGYPSGEMKHGPIALVTDEVPTLAIAVQDEVYTKMVSNIQEVKSRNGKVIAIATEGDRDIQNHADDVIYVPKVDTLLYPFVVLVALQWFAYHVANMRECDIDKPRNLAKSVTVE